MGEREQEWVPASVLPIFGEWVEAMFADGSTALAMWTVTGWLCDGPQCAPLCWREISERGQLRRSSISRRRVGSLHTV